MVALLPSCAHVTIHDAEVCGDKGTLGASCFHTLTTGSRTIEKNLWDDERFGMLCMDYTAFADFKEEIEGLCSLSKRCDYEAKQQIKAFFDLVARFHADATASK